MTLFHGLSAFPITPADPHGQVDTQALRRILVPIVAAAPASICVLGTTGTYAYLDRTQRRRTIEAAVREAAGRVPVLAGIGALRTDHAVQLGQDAQSAGAAGVLLAPMSYTRLTDDEVHTHFATVAAAVSLPLCIYNNPGTTGFTFTPALVARLAALPNVIAIKTPAPATNQAAGHQGWREAIPPGFSLGYSVDWHATEALLAGGQAWYSVAAGLLPHACKALADAALSGDAISARAQNARLQPLWDLFTEHSSLRVIYAAAQVLGLTACAPPLPVLPLPDGVRARVSQIVRGLRES